MNSNDIPATLMKPDTIAEYETPSQRIFFLPSATHLDGVLVILLCGITGGAVAASHPVKRSAIPEIIQDLIKEPNGTWTLAESSTRFTFEQSRAILLNTHRAVIARNN